MDTHPDKSLKLQFSIAKSFPLIAAFAIYFWLAKRWNGDGGYWKATMVCALPMALLIEWIFERPINTSPLKRLQQYRQCACVIACCVMPIFIGIVGGLATSSYLSLLGGGILWAFYYVAGIHTAITNITDVKERVTAIEARLGPIEKIASKVEDIPQKLEAIQNQQSTALADIRELKVQTEQLKKLEDIVEKLKATQEDSSKRLVSIEDRLSQINQTVVDVGSKTNQAIAAIPQPTSERRHKSYLARIPVRQASSQEQVSNPGKATAFIGELPVSVGQNATIQSITLTPAVPAPYGITSVISPEGNASRLREFGRRT